jgi:GABA(A) receptor-associated protein
MFKTLHSLEKRKSEAERIMKKYPDRIPVIVETGKYSRLPPLDKKKYLVPELTVGQFLYVLRNRIKLNSEEALFLFINNTLPATSALMSQIYKENKSDDNFLYCTLTSESVFG